MNGAQTFRQIMGLCVLRLRTYLAPSNSGEKTITCRFPLMYNNPTILTHYVILWRPSSFFSLSGCSLVYMLAAPAEEM